MSDVENKKHVMSSDDVQKMLDSDKLSELKAAVESIIRQEGVFEIVYPNKDILTLYKTGGSYYRIGEVTHLSMSYGEHTVEEIDGETKDCWMMNHSQYFLPEFLDKAFVALIARFKNNGMMDYDNPDMVGEKLQIIKIRQTQVLRFESHYDYCDAVLNDFWMEVFGMTSEQMWCGGIVGAHGDKAYGYKDKWNEAGIPFEHGVMLFLLSYTREYGDRPKHESHQWVIENYPKYKPKLEAAENKVLKEKFKNTVD